MSYSNEQFLLREKELKEKFTVGYYLKLDEEKKMKFRKNFLLSKYKLTLDKYNDILEQQKGLCAICHLKNKSGRRLAVDHCHETGKIRGLLCAPCNLGIGNFKNNKDFLLKAIEYLNG